MAQHTERPATRPERRQRSEAAILSAARRQFGECGFERTTIRSVAGEAGVDPALVMQYFGSKLDLFASAAQTDVETDRLSVAPPHELPQAALEDVFHQFEDPERREAAVALMRNCLTHPRVTAMVRDDVMGTAMAATLSRVDAEDAELRVALFNACIMGLVLGRYVIGVEPMTDASTDEIRQIFEPALAALLPPQVAEG